MVDGVINEDIRGHWESTGQHWESTGQHWAALGSTGHSTGQGFEWPLVGKAQYKCSPFTNEVMACRRMAVRCYSHANKAVGWHFHSK